MVWAALNQGNHNYIIMKLCGDRRLADVYFLLKANQTGEESTSYNLYFQGSKDLKI